MHQTMLSWKAGLGLCFLFASFFVNVQAQNTEEGLVIKQPFKKTTYNGKNFIKLPDQQKKEILFQTGDAKVQEAFIAYKRIKNVGLGIMGVGTAIGGVGLLLQLQGVNSDGLVNNGPYMTLGGMFIMVSGVVLMSTAGISQLKKATLRHKKLKLNASATLIRTPSFKQTPGVSLSVTF